MKLDLFANATVIDDAIRFVSQKSKENLKPSNSINKIIISHCDSSPR